MPEHKSHNDKEKDLRTFIILTWQVVRRNSEYRENYTRFLQNYGLLPEDVKRKKREDGFSIIRGWKDEAPDPQRCNMAYMMQRWGFACHPDEPIPLNPNWSFAFISKEWLNKRKKSGPIFSQPLMTEKFELQKLPGVLEVNRWPEVWLNDENKWETEAPPCLSVTINLQAPSQHINYALEFLVAVCKAELRIKGKVIEEKHIMKCLEIYDLHQKGCSEEDIADKIVLTHYKEEEAMRYGLDDYLREWGVPQVKRCLEDAEEIIKKGSII